MKNSNKLIFYICFVLIVIILALISIPKQNNVLLKENTFVYDNKHLSASKNTENLNNEEQNSITIINNSNSSVKIENNLTFSTQNSEEQINNIIDDAVNLTDGYIGKIDNKEFYFKDKNIFIDAIKQDIKDSFPSEDAYNQYINSKEIKPVEKDGKIFTDFKILNDINLYPAQVPENKIINSEEDFRFYLNNGDQEKKIVEVQEGETIDNILQANDLTVAEFNSNNNIQSNHLLTEGQVLIVNKPNPMLQIETDYQFSQEESLAFQKTEENTDELPLGEKKIKQEGKDGKQKVTYQTTYINGNETANEAIGNEIIEPGVNEITLVGQKEVSGKGTGSMQWPASSCLVTNGYGGADFAGVGHLAIDIQAGYGSPIFAADNGTVIFSGWDPYGGGNTVKIDHGNNIVTQYNHMMNASSLSVGQKVNKGQQIGNEGASGLVTGPHLHFEVRVNGQRVNPMDYVSC